MKTLNEVLVAVALLAVILLKIDPFHWFMPTEIQMVILCVFAAAFALYAGIIFREKAHDERESYHLALASRLGYLVGVVALSVAIVIQDIFHRLDPWLLGILSLMIVSKLAVLKYAKLKK